MEYSHTLAAHPVCIKELPMELNISPSIWQSYINAVLGCLQSKKYCEAIMDDLILFCSIKGVHMNKLEDILSTLIEYFIKKWTKFILLTPVSM